jgi:hypothetical protein
MLQLAGLNSFRLVYTLLFWMLMCSQRDVMTVHWSKQRMLSSGEQVMVMVHWRRRRAVNCGERMMVREVVVEACQN